VADCSDSPTSRAEKILNEQRVPRGGTPYVWHNEFELWDKKNFKIQIFFGDMYHVINGTYQKP
jgi:hypothetical protein